MITAVEESDGQDFSVVRRPIVIVSINDTIGAATVRRPLKRQGLERKSGAAGNRNSFQAPAVSKVYGRWRP